MEYELCSREEIAVIIAFFQVCKGRLHGFRYRDWSDYECFEQRLGVGNGIDHHFALSKNYVFGPHMVSRLITKPVQGTVMVMINGMPQYDGWSADYSTGVIAFDRAPLSGETVSASFSFDAPVRFDIDSLTISMMTHGRYSIKGVSLVEIMG